jgi:hypothetical protein
MGGRAVIPIGGNEHCYSAPKGVEAEGRAGGCYATGGKVLTAGGRYQAGGRQAINGRWRWSILGNAT